MKPEEFEVYVIPPNFMEGGTLFGGLLKTRNTIEAVILGLAVGVPVLHLPFSLTVRVVILCLTALPLVLLALIGVSGMSLSAFIRLFFCFLHNRRILSRDGTQGGKNGKTLLPSWAQQRKSDCEAEDPPLPKSRSRFSVDLKQRSVTQFKTFLQEEEAVQPLNALADYIPIEKIEHGVIYTRDHRYVKVVEVVPVNFLLRSAREQRSIIYSFISYLKIAPVKVQFKALTKRADINRHLDTVRRELEHEQDPRCRVLQEDYWCSKSGSYHTLIPGAAQAWGLSVEGCTASEPQRILDALADGKLVVALMTKGHFTKSGHFIVLRGVQDEKILVADPASYRRSQKTWDLSIILNEASRRAGAGGPFWIIG